MTLGGFVRAHRAKAASMRQRQVLGKVLGVHRVEEISEVFNNIL